MKKLIITLLLMPGFALASPCDELFDRELARSQAMEQADMADQLYKDIVDMRKRNGRLNRKAKVKRDRRFSLLKSKLKKGEHAQISDIYAPIFNAVELATYTIINHQAFFESEEYKNLGPYENMSDKQKDVVLNMAYELDQAFKDLGLNYVDYLTARRYLEGIAKKSKDDEPLQWHAEIVLKRLSLKLTARQYPDLGIDPDNPRPELDDVRDVFAENVEVRMALLQHEMDEETIHPLKRWGLFGVQFVERLALNISDFSFFGRTIRGSGIQKFMAVLVGISRDQYLKREYLNVVEEIVEQQDINFRAENLLEACNRQCVDLLETFARVGVFTDDWHDLKEHFKTQAESKGIQYKRIHGLMIKAEEIAMKEAGLSLNYEDITDQYGRRFMISSAARAAVILFATTKADTWMKWLTDIQNAMPF